MVPALVWIFWFRRRHRRYWGGVECLTQNSAHDLWWRIMTFSWF